MGLQGGAPHLEEERTARTHHAPTGTAASHRPLPLPQKCPSMLHGTAGLMSLHPSSFPTGVSLPLSLLPSPPRQSPPSPAPVPVLHPTEVCMHGTLPSQPPGSCRDVPSLAQDSRDGGLLSCHKGCLTAPPSPCGPLSRGTANCGEHPPAPQALNPAAACSRDGELQPGFSLHSSTVPKSQRRCCGGWAMPPLPFLQDSPAQPPAWSPRSNRCSELLKRLFQLPLLH